MAGEECGHTWLWPANRTGILLFTVGHHMGNAALHHSIPHDTTRTLHAPPPHKSLTSQERAL